MAGGKDTRMYHEAVVICSGQEIWALGVIFGWTDRVPRKQVRCYRYCLRSPWKVSRPQGWRGPRRLRMLNITSETGSRRRLPDSEACFSRPLPTVAKPSEMLRLTCWKGDVQRGWYSPGLWPASRDCKSSSRVKGLATYKRWENRLLVPLGASLTHSLCSFHTYCCSTILFQMKSY